jgi:hypothetical protein
MQRRNKNIRKACDDLKAIAKLLMTKTGKVNNKVAGEIIYSISHRIKRTTWRGQGKELNTIYIDLSKHLNTNQTTTAKVDVSTIPYY